MGITIHYRGRLPDAEQREWLIEEIADIASIMKWPLQRWKNRSAGKAGKGSRVLSLSGISFHPHPSSEPFYFTFDHDGNLRDLRMLPLFRDGTLKPEGSYVSVKTQFAGVETHVAAVKLLQYIKERYIPDLEVQDEGGYWESGDRAVVAGRIGSLNRAMDILSKALASPDSGIQEARTVEDMVRRIEDVLKDKFGFE